MVQPPQGAIRPKHGGDEIGKSAGVTSRTIAEVSNVTGFAAVFTGIGVGVTALAAAATGTALAAAFTPAILATVGISMAIGVAGIGLAAFVKKGIDDRELEIEATQGKGKGKGRERSHEIAQSIPELIEEKSTHFTDMIKAQRAQSPSEHTRH